MGFENQLVSGFFQEVSLNFFTDIISILDMYMRLFAGETKRFLTTLRHFQYSIQFSILRLGFTYWIVGLCHQLLKEFSSKQVETLHRCYKHSENVHVTLCRCKNNFDISTAFSTKSILSTASVWDSKIVLSTSLGFIKHSL